MLKSILVAVVCSVAFIGPAFALDGQEALDQCNKTAGCVGHQSGGKGGPIVIVGPKGGMVQCGDEKSECTVVFHAGKQK